jgi:hypothetical protein
MFYCFIEFLWRARPKKAGRAIHDKAGKTIFTLNNFLYHTNEPSTNQLLNPACLPAAIPHAPNTTIYSFLKR